MKWMLQDGAMMPYLRSYNDPTEKFPILKYDLEAEKKEAEAKK